MSVLGGPSCFLRRHRCKCNAERGRCQRIQGAQPVAFAPCLYLICKRPAMTRMPKNRWRCIELGPEKVPEPCEACKNPRSNKRCTKQEENRIQHGGSLNRPHTDPATSPLTDWCTGSTAPTPEQQRPATPPPSPRKREQSVLFSPGETRAKSRRDRSEPSFSKARRKSAPAILPLMMSSFL